MQSCFFSFSHIFDHADIFRFPMTLVLNKYEKTSTCIGKSLTLAIIVFLIYSFIISDVVKKINPQILSQDLTQASRPTMHFSKQNFTMAIGVANSDNIFFIDESVFSIVFYIYHLNNLEKIVNQTMYTLKPCVAEDFIEDPTEFDKLALNGTFCIPDQNLKLGGYWDEEEIDYIYLELRTCQNSSESNITCQSSDDISNYMRNNYIDIYLTNHNIDASNYLNPVTRNLKIYYQKVDLKLMKYMNLFIKNSIINTDDGFFFENNRNINTFIQGDIEYDVMLQKDQSDFIYQINIYSSNLQTKVLRNYQKIQTLLAQLGGICNFLFFFGILVCKIENHYRLISLMSNELFIFPKFDSKMKISTKEKSSQKSTCKLEKKTKKTILTQSIKDMTSTKGGNTQILCSTFENQGKNKKKIVFYFLIFFRNKIS